MTRDDSQHIAIIGAAGRFPHAPDLETFWDNLAAGRLAATRFTDADLEAAGVPLAVRGRPNYVPVRAVLESADQFDAELFGFSPTEARLTDPQARVFLEVAWTALEAAGYDSTRYPGPIGIYAGADQSHLATSLMLARAHDAMTLIGNNRDYLATRVAFELDLRGPAVTIQTACSTSLVAVQMACQSLLGFQCDIALAGGVGINFPQRAGYLFEEGGVLSPDGVTRSFDQNARGTFGGDGCGVVVLKRLHDALADGDTIRAVIEGAAINNDGAHKIGFTAPSVDGQAEVIAMAHAVAGVGPEDIHYIEAHGTGTPLGDTVEISALDDVFKARTSRRKFCSIGSLKTNLGHLNSASGIAGLLKTMLALEHRALPPSLNFETPNPEIGWDDSCFTVNTTYRPWPQTSGARRAGVSSFGVGGTNAHIVLRDAPPRSAPAAGRPANLLVVSAHTAAALERATANLAQALGEEHYCVDDFAYTTLVGRRPLKHRRMVVVGSNDAAAKALLEAPAVAVTTPPSVYFYCAGGGTPRPVSTLIREEPRLLADLENTLGMLPTELATRVRDALLRDHESRDIAVTGLADLAMNLALDRFWRSLEIVPAGLVANGHGALTAACLAEVIRCEDAIAMLVGLSRGHTSGAALQAGRKVRVRPPRVPIHSAPALIPFSDSEVMSADFWLGPFLAEPGRDAPAVPASSPTTHVLDLGSARWSDVLREVGRLFLAGISVDGTALFLDQGRRRVALPTYPFEHRSYLPEIANPLLPAASELSPPAATHKLPTRRWLYFPTWLRQAPCRPPSIADTTWIVFGDNRAYDRRVVKTMISAGARIINVTRGSDFKSTAQGFVIAPREPEHYARLFDQVFTASSETRPVHALFLWDSLEPGHPPSQPIVALRSLAAGWSRHRSERELRLTLITSGTAAPIGDEAIDPMRAAIHAATQLPEECEGLELKVIDVDPGLSADALASLVTAEPDSRDLDRLVAVRGNARFVPTYLPIDTTSRETPSALREAGNYLIIGGLGQLGLALALGLAGRYRARLVLTSRESFPARKEWATLLADHRGQGRLYQRLRAIAAIEATGAAVECTVVDTSDPGSIESAIELTRERFGGLHGLILAAGGAGAESLGLISEGDPESCQRGIEQRLDAARAVVAAAPKTLDFVLLNSSLSTIVGGIGLYDYAASHHALDALALAASEQRPRVVAIDWDAWRPPLTDSPEFGIAGAIGPDEGAEVLAWTLAEPHLPRVAVSTSDLERRRGKSPEGRRNRTLKTTPSTLHPRPALDTVFVAPRTPIESQIAEIWQRLFSIAPLGVDDNFFELGGDSLMAIQLRADLRDRLSADVSLEDLLQEPTIAAITNLIESGQERMRAERGAIDGTLAMVENMSDDDVKRMLAELAAGKARP